MKDKNLDDYNNKLNEYNEKNYSILQSTDKNYVYNQYSSQNLKEQELLNYKNKYDNRLYYSDHLRQVELIEVRIEREELYKPNTINRWVWYGMLPANKKMEFR